VRKSHYWRPALKSGKLLQSRAAIFWAFASLQASRMKPQKRRQKKADWEVGTIKRYEIFGKIGLYLFQYPFQVYLFTKR